MPHLRMQFTVRELAIVIGLIALNLAAAITSWRWYRDSANQASISQQREGLRIEYPPGTRPAGAIRRVEAKLLQTGETLECVIWPPPPPGLLQILSPVIASLSITFLVLAIPRTSLASGNDSAPDVGGSTARLVPSRWDVARRSTIVAALIGLNLAGAVYRPLPETTEDRRMAYTFSSYYGNLNQLSKPSYFPENDRFVIVWSDGSRTRPRPGDVEAHILETIVCKPDGSIVYYEGNPGLLRRLFAWPRILREPDRSMLEMWWPALVAAVITLLVLRSLWSRTRRPRDDNTLLFGVD